MSKILVVDDSPLGLQMITDGLMEDGYNVIPVNNGPQALEVAREKMPDLILLDIIMPVMDGYEVCRELKENPITKSIPVIFLTALTFEQSEEKGLLLGAVDYITKPIFMPILKARVHAHMELKLKRDQLLLKTEELTALNTELEAFSYTASHDLKAPLNIIKMYSGFLKDDFKGCNNQDGVEDIETIEAACNKMTQLIEDLLQLAKVKQDGLVFEKINLSGLAEMVCQEIQLLEKSKPIEFICEPKMEAIVDLKLMRIALFNLMHNAWKYSSKKEFVQIAFGRKKIANKNAYFIKDNGVGMDVKKAEGLFTAFKRFHKDEEFEGTGIGLAIVKRIVERHNGEIWIESEPSKGTTVYFTL